MSESVIPLPKPSEGDLYQAKEILESLVAYWSEGSTAAKNWLRAIDLPRPVIGDADARKTVCEAIAVLQRCLEQYYAAVEVVSRPS